MQNQVLVLLLHFNGRRYPYRRWRLRWPPDAILKNIIILTDYYKA